MRLKDIISHDYFKLFVKCEGKIVLGKRYANMWLLCGVLLATFLAIAFSNASLDYLSYKMNDPFINWVDIKNDSGEYDFESFEEFLRDEEMMSKFHFSSYQTDQYKFATYATQNASSTQLRCRFFENIQTNLVYAILDDDNVISDYKITEEKLDNNSYGVIITQDALVNKLGYKSEIPNYIFYKSVTDPEASEEFGITVIDGFACIPVPVLGVVKRLPTNMDIIGTKHFYRQYDARSFNMYEPLYFCSFLYYLPSNVDTSKFMKFLEKTTMGHTDMSYYTNDNLALPLMESYGDGHFVSLKFDYEDEVDFMVNKAINDAIMEEYGKKGVIRMYDYITNNYIDTIDDFIAIHFNDLNKIVEFQEYAKEEYKINIEMSQINAKKNFNEVSIMANILSWTMIVFAIICIILFIVNLLQSYFQKVKRNLGTFKAFGIRNKDLISVYVLIMLVTICVAITIALVVTLLIQGLLPIVGLMKDGIYNYLDLWSGKTLGAIIIIIAASGYTVYLVVNQLLKATPGDLIYDR